MNDGSTTELIVVRHGETACNAEGRLQGHRGGALSPRGHEQSAAVAERLSETRFDALYSSDLARAHETAGYIARRTGHEIMTDPRLRERCMGVFEGLTWHEAETRYPEEMARYRERDPDYVFPEGESWQQVYDRVVACSDEMARRHVGRTVVVVSHGGVLHRMFRHTVGLPFQAPRTWTIYNASINRFLIGDGTWMLGTWGDIGHLEEIGTSDDR